MSELNTIKLIRENEAIKVQLGILREKQETLTILTNKLLKRIEEINHEYSLINPNET